MSLLIVNMLEGAVSCALRDIGLPKFIKGRRGGSSGLLLGDLFPLLGAACVRYVNVIRAMYHHTRALLIAPALAT
jgi:hypothetical protein